MKKIGDKIEWNTKSGIARGVVEGVRLRARYIVKIDRSSQYMDIAEDVDPSELLAGELNTEFLQIVWKMRDAQKRYFDRSDTESLKESIMLEKKVDAIIEMCQTPDLFTENYGTEELRINY